MSLGKEQRQGRRTRKNTYRVVRGQGRKRLERFSSGRLQTNTDATLGQKAAASTISKHLFHPDAMMNLEFFQQAARLRCYSLSSGSHVIISYSSHSQQLTSLPCRCRGRELNLQLHRLFQRLHREKDTELEMWLGVRQLPLAASRPQAKPKNTWEVEKGGRWGGCKQRAKHFVHQESWVVESWTG